MAPWNKSNLARISPRKLFKEHHFTILSFFIPFIIMWLAYATRGIFPFGNRDLLTIDLYHQYAPFIAELRAKLLGGESLFYSWSGGLGTNFYALFAYYLASPLNIITIIFPPSFLTEAILFLTLIKIGLAGACFYRFLRGTYGREGHYAVAFSVMYALSSYVLSYSWNIMWLDGIYLLPLIMLGLVRLLRDNRPLLYVASMALMIASNYYIAFFVCLFTILYFPVLLLRYQTTQRAGFLLYKSGEFGFYSLLAGGLAAVMLLPTYFSLQLTSAANDKFPTDLTFYYDFFDYIGQHSMLTAPTIRDGMPNMYAGLLLLILLPVYFLSRRVQLREKFVHIALIIVLILSFNINYLNFIWHGFHFPNQLPYRNSFVYIFLLLAMLYPAAAWLRDLKARQIGSICLALMFLPLLAQKLNQTKPSVQSIFVTIIFLAIYAAVLTLDRTKKLDRQDLARAVMLLVVAELVLNTLLTVHEIDMNEHYSSRDGYAAGRQVRMIRDEIDVIESENDKLFYRMEIMSPKTTNDPYLYQYNGLSLFSSTASTRPVKTFENLGYHSNGINSYKYEGSTIVLDSLFGIEYLFRRAVDIEDEVRQMTVQNDLLTVYKNPYALPIGYLGTSALETWSSSPGSPFNAQNKLVEALGGLPEVLVPQDQIQAANENITLNNTGNFTYRYDRTDAGQKSTAKIRIINPVDQTLYGYLKVTANQPSEGFVLIDGKRVNFNARRSTMVEIGHVKAGANVEFNLVFDSSAPQTGQFEFYASALDKQAFEHSIDLIAAQPLELTDISARKLSGTVSAARDGVFLMTIPYDTGWSVKIDGRKTETIAIDEGLLAFRLQSGDHSIEMKYTPPWFWQGLLISLGSLLVVLAVYKYTSRPVYRQRNRLPRIYYEWDEMEMQDEAKPLVIERVEHVEHRPLPDDSEIGNSPFPPQLSDDTEDDNNKLT